MSSVVRSYWRPLVIGGLACCIVPGVSERCGGQTSIERHSNLPAGEIPPLPDDGDRVQVQDFTSTAESEEVSPAAPDALESPLTLDQLEAMAFENHPAIGRAQALIAAARGTALQVGLAPNPTIGYEGQQIGSRGLAEQDGIFVGQEFVRGGKRQLNRQVATRGVQLAQQELAATMLRIRTDVRTTAYQVLIAERQQRLAADLAQIAREGLKSAESLYHAKEVGKPDVLQAIVEVENANLLAQNARTRWQMAWQRLATVIGQPGLAPQPLQGDLDEIRPVIDREATIEQLLSSSPEIARAVTEIERARWALARAQVEPRPNVTVQGLVNVRDNGIGGRSDGSVQVSLPLPVRDRNQGAIQQARGELVAAQRALSQLELALRQRFAQVYERYATALAQVQRYRQSILPTAQESLELTRKSYQVGEIGFIDLLTAQRTYFQTSLTYLESLQVLRLAEAEIDGYLLQDSLENRSSSP